MPLIDCPYYGEVSARDRNGIGKMNCWEACVWDSCR